MKEEVTTVVGQWPAPQPGDHRAWAALSAKAIDTARTWSTKIAEEDHEKTLARYFRAGFRKLDRYTRYATPDQARNTRARREGFGGLGITIRYEEGKTFVRKVHAGTPAARAGLKAGESPHLYSVAKAAVIHLTKSVALELGEDNIRVNCICPGIVATPLAAGHPDTSEVQLEKLSRSLRKAQALGRIGAPDDIARAAVWLASDESSWVTGTAQVVDGGAAAGRPWRRQGDWITKNRPLKMYRPEGR